MQKPVDDLFQFEVLGADETIPVAISPLLDEVTATMLFERSAVGPGYELQLHYRGVLVRRRDRESEQRVMPDMPRGVDRPPRPHPPDDTKPIDCLRVVGQDEGPLDGDA